MPYASGPSLAFTVAVDEVARQRAASLVPHVADAYGPRPKHASGSTPAPEETVDEAYVLTGAVRIGLNHWTLPASHPPKPDVFFTKKGTGVALVQVDVSTEDAARATALSERIFVPVDAILSCAACTGLAMLSGDHEVVGPFEV